MREKRRKVWIDRFQTYLFLRIALYCVLNQIALWGVLVLFHYNFAAWEAALGDAGAAVSLTFAGGILLFLGFLFVYDSIKFTHRIVGPLYRVRKTIQAVLAGEEVDPVRFRKGDLLNDMRDELNEMLQLLEQRGVIVIKKPAEVGQGRPVASV